MPVFRLVEESLQERFLNSRAKIQLYGGGFANGKTSASCIKAIQLAKDYPGCNGLMARSTYPKLNDTLRAEFVKWCPPDWIKSFPKSQNASNTCLLTNGSSINFRYIAQQGKTTQETTTSNLLSATYDWAIVDQIEDPEIVHKDFLDILGRLRGMTPYAGTDPTMPRNGPRWFIITCNPTRNWVYRELVKPIHDLQRGQFNEKLLCETDPNGKIRLDESKKPVPIIEIYEGSTYENESNLESDFIQTLEATYRGQMRDRFLMGRWLAYEGLVYPHFDDAVHVLHHHSVVDYYRRLVQSGAEITYLEGYDYGMAVPSCYLCGFVDDKGNVLLLDGFYDKEMLIDVQIAKIKEIRQQYNIPSNNHIYADPSIFKRNPGRGKLVGKSTASMFLDEGIYCERGNANISNGIIKVSQYLVPLRNHQNPVTGVYNSPYMYVSSNLEFVHNEFNDYYWKRDTTGDITDVPMDKNDHAMDTIKYILTDRPPISKLIVPLEDKPIGWRQWGERDLPEGLRSPRHAH
jgi:phage terminase large subunit